MMSNCAFWSASGELLAVHGALGTEGGPDPRTTFADWAAAQRLPPGRLVGLSPGFPIGPAPGVGWQRLAVNSRPRRPRPPRPCPAAAPVATAAPALDEAAGRLMPASFIHEKFTLKAWPTWVLTAQPEPEEGPQGWYAALREGAKASVFLVRLVPHRGRLPGEGWRNMLSWSLRAHWGVRLVPLNGLPRPEVLAQFPAWEYRVEAGNGPDAAAWDVQVLPSRHLLLDWAPGASDAWEATAWLRWVRPHSKGVLDHLPTVRNAEPRWADLFARWPVADARLVVQNVLNTLPGGAPASAVLFWDTVTLAPDAAGRTLVRHIPQEGLPLALLSTLFGRRTWQEVERAKRLLPSLDEVRVRRSEALEALDRRLADGRLVWSPEADDLWNALYREPRHQAWEQKLTTLRRSDRWSTVLSGDRRVPETLLRTLDVTDAALCLRDVPDSRWRRFVTARRETELRAEQEFCLLWEARGELTLERQLEAWRAWDEIIASLALTDSRGER